MGSTNTKVAATLVFQSRFMSKILATMPADAAPSPLSDSEYHRLADGVLASIEASVDRWLQDDVIDIDCRRTGGMLELGFPDRSTIVVNKQPPLHELWLATRGGGFHYRHVNGQWVDGRDGSDFYTVLSKAAAAQGGKALVFNPA
jgi:CyaY protein